MAIASRFGVYGGQYVPETLMPALIELEAAFEGLADDRVFAERYAQLLRDFVGRPTALFHAERLSAKHGFPVLLKREDLAHTGAHKINNSLGQALLAHKLGKKRVIAETGAGQHGVATAAACALLGLECSIFMGERDMERQAPNVQRMRLFGAEIVPVTAGEATLKEATSEAIREWVSSVRSTHYIIGTASGPHPYPSIVREFQSIIGREMRAQCLERYGRLPSQVLACIGGGSNAIGAFAPFLDDSTVKLIGLEAAGHGLHSKHAATLTMGRPGVLHGTFSYLLQDEHGAITEAHSISAGLDYPGVGPEHSHLKDTGRVHYAAITDQEALLALRELCLLEGILPALETAHALAYLSKLGESELGSDPLIIINLSGRGDKDMNNLQS